VSDQARGSGDGGEIPKTTIDLDRTGYATALSYEHSLHKREIAKALGLIRAHLRDMDAHGAPCHDGGEPRPPSGRGGYHEAETSGWGMARDPRHDSILIHGPRGSGKSTFLLTLTGLLRREWNSGAYGRSGRDGDGLSALGGGGGPWAAGDLRNRVHVLPKLDPTLVEGDEVFLATITANILSEIDRSPRGAADRDSGALSDALQELARAFPILSPSGTQEALKRAAGSPSLFAELLLQGSSSGIHLARSFERFCCAAANALGVRLLIQPLDDVDVAMDQGWDVLETTRRYLSNRHILAILSGDMQLFRAVVRTRQWKALKPLKDMDGAGGGLVGQVRELEDQYLLKLLSPARRVALPTVTDRIFRSRSHLDAVKVRWIHQPQGEAKPKQRETTLVELLEVGQKHVLGIPGPIANSPTGRALVPANTREAWTVIRWLTSIHDTVTGIASEADQEKKGSAASTADQERLSEFPGEYLDIYPLVQERMELDRTALAGLPRDGFAPWAQWLATHDHEAFRAEDHAGSGGQSSSGVSIRRSVWPLDAGEVAEGPLRYHQQVLVHAVAATFVHYWRSFPLDQLAYFGRIGAPMSAWSRVPEKDSEAADQRARWLLGSTEPAWLTAARVTATQISNTYPATPAVATRLPPKRFKYPKKQRLAQLAAYFKRGHKQVVKWSEPIKKARFGIDPWLRHRLNTAPDEPLILNAVTQSSKAWWDAAPSGARLLYSWYRITLRKYNQHFQYVDPWKGIAAVARLWSLRAITRDIPAPGDVGDQDAKDFWEAVLNLSAVHDVFPIERTGTADELSDYAEEEVGAETIPLKEPDRALVRAMVAWVKWAPGGDSETGRIAPLRPAAWATVARRFADNLQRMGENVPLPSRGVGADLQRWVLAFLYSVFVVEAQELRTTRVDPRFMVSVFESPASRRPWRTTATPKPGGLFVQAIKRELEIRAEGKRLAPRLEHGDLTTRFPTTAWLASCPLLHGVLCDAWFQELKKHFSTPDDENQACWWDSKDSEDAEGAEAHVWLSALLPPFEPPPNADDAPDDPEDLFEKHVVSPLRGTKANAEGAGSKPAKANEAPPKKRTTPAKNGARGKRAPSSKKEN